jgi:lysophospholipase L1-like esterase
MPHHRLRTRTVLVVAMLTAALAEAGAALWLTRKGGRPATVRARNLFDPFRGHRLNPEYRGPDVEGERAHSPDGFREPAPVARTKQPDTYRVILGGASAVYGLGATAPYPTHRALRHEEALDSQLERALEAGTGREVEVINAGVPAYWTFQQLVYVNDTLLDYEPDLLLFVDGNNDFYRIGRGEGPWREYRYSSRLWLDGLNSRDTSFTALVLTRYLARASWFFLGLERLFTRRFEESRRRHHTDGNFLVRPEVPIPTPAAFRRELRDNVARHYWQMGSLGGAYGFQMAVALQPQLVFEAPEMLGPRDRELRNVTLRLTGVTPERVAAVRAYVPLVGKVITETNARIVFLDHHRLADTEPVTDGLYLDYCHLSAAGSRRLAERLAAQLEPLVTQRPPGAAALP